MHPEVHLVQHDQMRKGSDLLVNLEVLLLGWLTGIQKKEHEVRSSEELPGALRAQLLHIICALPQARSIHEPHRDALYRNPGLNVVARGPRNGRHEGALFAGQLVQQTGLSHIRLAHEDHEGPLPEAAPLAVAGKERLVFCD